MPKVRTKSLRSLADKIGNVPLIQGALLESANYIDELEAENKQIKEEYEKIKKFCENEATICADLSEKNQHKLIRILFEGKQKAFNSVINHINNSENS